MRIQHPTVHRAEEAFGIAVDFIALAAVAVVHGAPAAPHTAVGGDCLVWFGEFFPQRLGNRARHAVGQIHDFKGIPISLVEFDLMQAQGQHLVAVRCLQDTPQGLGMKAVGRDNQFRHGALQSDNLEPSGRGKDGQSVLRVIPK